MPKLRPQTLAPAHSSDKSKEVPEIPPSPQQISVDLHSLSGLYPEERPPSPLQYTIDLYSLTDLEQWRHLTSKEGYEDAPEEPKELAPVPQELTIDLYSLSELGGVELDVLPSPRKHSIDLYSLPEVVSGHDRAANIHVVSFPETPPYPETVPVDEPTDVAEYNPISSPDEGQTHTLGHQATQPTSTDTTHESVGPAVQDSRARNKDAKRDSTPPKY